MISIFLGDSNIQVWELLQVLKKTPLKGALKISGSCNSKTQ